MGANLSGGRAGRLCHRTARPRQHWSAKEAAKGCRRRSAGRSSAAACRGRIPKKLASLGFGRRATPAQKTLVVQKLRQKHALSILLSIAQLPRATFYYHLKQMQREDKYASVKPANKKSSPQADLTKENIAGSGRRKAQHQKAAANAPTCRA